MLPMGIVYLSYMFRQEFTHLCVSEKGEGEGEYVHCVNGCILYACIHSYSGVPLKSLCLVIEIGLLSEPQFFRVNLLSRPLGYHGSPCCTFIRRTVWSLAITTVKPCCLDHSAFKAVPVTHVLDKLCGLSL